MPDGAIIPAMSGEAIARVAMLERQLLALPQTPLETQHVLHAGLYSRTLLLPAGEVMTGALIKIATLLIVQGDTLVLIEGETRRITGYAVLPAAAGRKQAFLAIADTHITMIFPTAARSVVAAEREFTDEADRLASRRPDHRNIVVITGE